MKKLSQEMLTDLRQAAIADRAGKLSAGQWRKMMSRVSEAVGFRDSDSTRNTLIDYLDIVHPEWRGCIPSYVPSFVVLLNGFPVGLSDKNKHIVQAIADGFRTPQAICDRLEISNTNFHSWIQPLLRNGLVLRSQEGSGVFYALADSVSILKPQREGVAA